MIQGIFFCLKGLEAKSDPYTLITIGKPGVKIMLDLNRFAAGNENIEEALARYGLEIPDPYRQFVNQARNNLRFLIIMNFMTQKEAQVCMNRMIVKMLQWVKEIEE